MSRENLQLIKLINLATEPSSSQMSFSQRSDDSNYQLLHTAPSKSMNEREFSLAVTNIQSQIQSFHENLTVCARVVENIGNPNKDSAQQRSKLLSSLELCTATAREIHFRIEGLPVGNDKNKKQIKTKLSSDFVKLRSEFQSVSTMAKQKQQSSINSMQQAQAQLQNNERKQESYRENDREQSYQKQQQVRMSDEVAANRAKIMEQQAQYQNIERDIVQLEDIFKDLNMLVMEQGIQIDNIESNISSTRDYAKQGKEEIDSAAAYQKSTRNKICCIVAILAIVALVLILVLTHTLN